MSIPKHETEAGVRLRVTELETENARLQERVEEAERDPGWGSYLRQKIDEDKVRRLLKERDHYKTQAERRKEALKALAKRGHYKEEHPWDFEACMRPDCLDARAAIEEEA